MIAAEGQIGVNGAELNATTTAASSTAAPSLGCGALGGGRWGCGRGCAGGIARSEAVRLRQGGNQLHTEGRFAGIVQAGLEADTRIVGRGARIRINLRRGRRRCGLLLLLLLRAAERGKDDRQCE